MTPRLTKFLALTCACAFPLAIWAQAVTVTEASAQGPDARMKAEAVEVRAKVVELDTARRLATLKGPKGDVVTVDVPETVRNLDQMRVGDDVVVRYAVAVVAALEPVSRSGIRERVESVATARAAAGQMPGVGTQRTVEVLAVIQALNAKGRTATLRGAKRTVTVRVPDGIDMGRLKVGDEVRALLVEAVVVNVERAPVR